MEPSGQVFERPESSKSADLVYFILNATDYCKRMKKALEHLITLQGGARRTVQGSLSLRKKGQVATRSKLTVTLGRLLQPRSRATAHASKDHCGTNRPPDWMGR